MIEISTENLRCLLSSLPQELYDEIYDLTFAVPSDVQVRYINEDWKPPHLLHVDHFSRRNYAGKYFRSTFIFRFFQYRVIPQQPVFRWLKTQDSNSLQHVSGIKLARAPVAGATFNSLRPYYSFCLVDCLRDKADIATALCLARMVEVVAEDHVTRKALVLSPI